MHLNAPPKSTKTQQNLVLKMLGTHGSLGGQDIRQALGCSALNVHQIMEDLISRGLVQADHQGPVRYSMREFQQNPLLVREDWIPRIQEWFQDGRSETVFGLSRHLKLKVSEVQATLEEMRQRKLLHGRFVGQMCVYALHPRGTTVQPQG